MASFDLGRKFPLIVCPLDGFISLESMQEQIDALRCFRKHLEDGGLIILDLVNPHTIPDPSENGRIRRRFEAHRGDEMVAAYDAVDVDLAAQKMIIHLTYDSFEGSSLRRETVDLCLKWLYRYELELLLERAGLRQCRLYGDYDLSPYATDSPRMIVTAQSAD